MFVICGSKKLLIIVKFEQTSYTILLRGRGEGG